LNGAFDMAMLNLSEITFYLNEIKESNNNNLKVFLIKNNANLQSTPSGAISKCVKGSKPEGRSHTITTLRHISKERGRYRT
jgi:hypothetical protein